MRRRTVALLAVLAALTGLAVTVAPAASATATVGIGYRLGSGTALVSAANGYRLSMNTDGNLVLYTDHAVPLWSTGTSGRGPSYLVFQSGGNLVVRTNAGVATWSTGSKGGTTLTVRDDGNVVMRKGSTTVWCTCAIPFTRVVGRPAALAAGGGLLGGDALAAGTATLTLQTDGNLVLRRASTATWTTRTAGGNRSKLALQTDGNLVLRGSDNRALWTSGTTGRGARTLRLGSDGVARLLTASGATVWSAGTPPATTPTGIAGDVFALLNRQRAAHGLPALVSDPRLVTSAARHNTAMAAANQLSHQLPGEAGLGARITAAGYSWHYVAENIAWTTNATSAGAQEMQTKMYQEVPPNDGHRQNILSGTARHVGVAVLVDSRGQLWLTTDFGAP
ncbi:CAP domain-containing protein [Jatrophihabitans sp. YIM 134969]